MTKLTGNGRPTMNTPGEVGQYYEDLNTGDIYECRRSSKYSPTHGAPVGGYWWELRVSGEDIKEHGDLYDIFVEEPCVKTITFDGQTDRPGCYFGWFYKVSDDTPSVEDVLGHVYKIVDGLNDIIITVDDISFNADGNEYMINNMIAVCMEDIEGRDGKGIYLAWHPSICMVTEMSYNSTKKVIKPELIPEVSAGGGSDVPVAIMRSVGYLDFLAGVATAITLAATEYECINMTFEEAIAYIQNGAPLAVKLLTANGNSTLIEISSYYSNMMWAKYYIGASQWVIQFADRADFVYYWTATGISTEKPSFMA